jgi:hypothetical protein
MIPSIQKETPSCTSSEVKEFLLVVDQGKAWEKDVQRETKKGDFIKKQSKISYSAEASESDSGAYSHRIKYKRSLSFYMILLSLLW